MTVTAATLAGPGVQAMPQGGSATVTLEQGQVLNVESDQAEGDLTGSHIKADQRVAVFGGHECATTSDFCCCDHLEEQLLHVQAWGKEYILSHSMERAFEPEYFRVMAAQADTMVTTDPPVAPITVLGPGGWFEFKAQGNFQVLADKPIQVGQYLASSFEVPAPEGFEWETTTCWSASECPQGYTCDWGTCTPPYCSTDSDCPPGHVCWSEDIFGSYCQPAGDPSLMMAVPVEQYQESFVFLTPDSYAQDYVNIVAPAGVSVIMDGAVLPPGHFSPVGNSGFSVYRTAIPDGAHTISAMGKVGILVYGYDKDVSYGYAGGMGLKSLAP
jgi:hypothetical protein